MWNIDMEFMNNYKIWIRLTLKLYQLHKLIYLQTTYSDTNSLKLISDMIKIKKYIKIPPFHLVICDFIGSFFKEFLYTYIGKILYKNFYHL